ncbi:UDP-glycosyltransferase 74F2-like [Malania oleifera]|uniref:UDP-glycosyltransferase 74F2-like n=1 Tax=Malania oleifera TaxID=397392 RepID=UPI0025AEA354|nr:UDP-glycosyltransferase 74F2-like [Malania oleifera]
MEAARKREDNRAHVLVLPYPTQGHINPLLQLSKRLASKGLIPTFAVTVFISKTMQLHTPIIRFDTISDGYDDGGFAHAKSIDDYISQFEAEGSKTLAELIKKQESTFGHPFSCIIYDSFMPWALDVAKRFGLAAAAFFTQPCFVNYTYYYAHTGVLSLPASSSRVLLPGLPELDASDMPSLLYAPSSYPSYFKMVFGQYSNIEKADYVLVNTFYELEEEVVDSMSKISPLMTIGPTVPSFYLDNRVQNDSDYDLNLFNLDPDSCIHWLHTKPKDSVVYVAFGSLAALGKEQMEELAWGLKRSNSYFLWVVRKSEEEKLPENFIVETSEKGLLVNWSPQLKVLSSPAVGCFFTHCGWNSTMEALSLGVPMVGMPQWTDQPTNAKFIADVWNVGVRVQVDKESGIVGREEVERCIREVMEGESGQEMRKNAEIWRDLTKEAVSEGGSSDKNINEFVSKILGS